MNAHVGQASEQCAYKVNECEYDINDCSFMGLFTWYEHILKYSTVRLCKIHNKLHIFKYCASVRLCAHIREISRNDYAFHPLTVTCLRLSVCYIFVICVWQHTVACGVVLLDSAAVKSRHRHPSSQRCERAPHTHATHHPNYAEWAISIECNAFESMYSLR